MLKSQLLPSILLVTAVGAFAQSHTTGAPAVPDRNDQEARAVRAHLAYGFEESWNSHNPAMVATPDRCADGAVFINVTGRWVKGCQELVNLLTPLHAPGGRFHDLTRRHVVEDLRFIRPDVAIAVVKTFDHKIAGVPQPGRETRGLVVLVKEGGHWKTVANQNTLIQAAPDGDR